MSELSPDEPAIAGAGADLGKHKTAAEAARGAQTFAGGIFTLETIDDLTGGRLGVHDLTCPFCADGRSRHGQARRVLRIWRSEPGWAGFYCARCDARGHASDRSAPRPDPAKLARARQEADEC